MEKQFADSIRNTLIETYISFLNEERVNDEKFINYINEMIDSITNVVSTYQPVSISPEIYAWRVIDNDILLLIINNQSEGFSGRYSAGKNKKDKKLILNVGNTSFVKDFEDRNWKSIIDGMRNVLFHELTHYIDFERMESHEDYITPRKRASVEFNAVFNSIIQHFYKKADNIASSKEIDKLSLFHKEFGTDPTHFLKNTMDILRKNKVITDEFPMVDKWHWKKRLFDTYRILRDRVFKTIISKESIYRV